jgi:hypothetical protein
MVKFILAILVVGFIALGCGGGTSTGTPAAPATPAESTGN